MAIEFWSVYSGRRIALVDGNNFYVSCERVFQPKLMGRPVIVLSNNDDCAVARSQEAKDLGIKMGQPLFQISKEVMRQGEDNLLSKIPVSEVWGVGRRLTPQLEAMGIRTALGLKRANRASMAKRFSVVLARTIDELNGQPCLGLDEFQPDKQTIMTSRSFAQTVSDYDGLASAVTGFAAKSAQKFRHQGGIANSVYVFVQTNRFAQEPQYNPEMTVHLSVATDDTLRITRAALYGLKRIFKRGFNYKQAGMMLSGLERRGVRQLDMFSRFDEAKSARLMAALDGVNAKFGSNTLRLANTTGQMGDKSSMRRERKSPNYTTCWSDLPVAS